MSNSKTKKIGMLSGIIFVLGSTIGAGIFVKNGSILSLNNGNIFQFCASWIIAIVAVIALALTLKEICSGSKGDTLGLVGWVKTYNNKFAYNSAKNFIAYIYLPTNYFFMPLYAVQQFAFGIGWTGCSWPLTLLIGFLIMMYFVLTSGISAKISNIHSWVVMCVKFIPIAIACIIGYIYLGTDHPFPNHNESNSDPFVNLFPLFGVMLSVPAIFFAFDGFYASTGIQSSLKEPKKISTILTLGLFIVSIIYVLIAISLFVFSSDGTLSTSNGFLPSWLYITLQVMITFGILGIVNSFALFGTNVYRTLLNSNEVVGCKIWRKSSNFKQFGKVSLVGAMLYSLLLYTIFYILLSVLGCFYFNTYGDSSMPGENNGLNNNIFSLADALSNWTSLFAFAIIAIAAAGCLRNRKTHKVNVKKEWYFAPSAYISIIIVCISILFVFAQVTYDFGYELTQPDTWDLKLSSFMPIVVIIIFFAISCIPSIIACKHKTNVSHKKVHR